MVRVFVCVGVGRGGGASGGGHMLKGGGGCWLQASCMASTEIIRSCFKQSV